MCDGDGSAGGDLLLEDGDDGAVGAEDVPESNGGELGFAVDGERLHEELCDAFGGAHDAGRVDGLVGGDEDAGVDFGALCGSDDVEGTDDVVFHGLGGVCLHEGDVFMGGGVEDDLRACGLHDVEEPLGVVDIGDDGPHGDVGECAEQLAFEVEERVLGLFDEDDLHGAEAGDLSAEFGADGAAGAGDEDDFVVQVLGDDVAGEAHGRAAEEVS